MISSAPRAGATFTPLSLRANISGKQHPLSQSIRFPGNKIKLHLGVKAGIPPPGSPSIGPPPANYQSEHVGMNAGVPPPASPSTGYPPTYTQSEHVGVNAGVRPPALASTAYPPGYYPSEHVGMNAGVPPPASPFTGYPPAYNQSEHVGVNAGVPPRVSASMAYPPASTAYPPGYHPSEHAGMNAGVPPSASPFTGYPPTNNQSEHVGVNVGVPPPTSPSTAYPPAYYQSEQAGLNVAPPINILTSQASQRSIGEIYAFLGLVFVLSATLYAILFAITGQMTKQEDSSFYSHNKLMVMFSALAMVYVTFSGATLAVLHHTATEDLGNTYLTRTLLGTFLYAAALSPTLLFLAMFGKPFGLKVVVWVVLVAALKGLGYYIQG